MSEKLEFELKILSWKINKVGKSIPEKGKIMCNVPKKSVGQYFSHFTIGVVWGSY